MNIPSVWVRLDDEPYREFKAQELIDVTVHQFPTFDTIPNELPSATRLRWRTEYMSLTLRQKDWLMHWLSTVFCAYAACRSETDVPDEMLHRVLRDQLSRDADRFVAKKWTSMLRPEVFKRHTDARELTEVHVQFALWGGSVFHTLHLTPVKP